MQSLNAVLVFICTSQARHFCFLSSAMFGNFKVLQGVYFDEFYLQIAMFTGAAIGIWES